MDSLFIEQHILLSWQWCTTADKTAVSEEGKKKEFSIIQGLSCSNLSACLYKTLTGTKHDFACFLFLLHIWLTALPLHSSSVIPGMLWKLLFPASCLIKLCLQMSRRSGIYWLSQWRLWLRKIVTSLKLTHKRRKSTDLWGKELCFCFSLPRSRRGKRDKTTTKFDHELWYIRLILFC